MTLQDFVEHPYAEAAGLSAAHVVALRIYTTHIFKYLNGPLRSNAFGRGKKPHPLPITMTFLDEALRKMRIVRATEQQGDLTGSSLTGSLGRFVSNAAGRQPTTGHKGPTTLWRGMRNLHVADDFMEDGGSEVHVFPPCMSSACMRARM